MTQDELWEKNYRLILDFMNEQKKRPSKHHLEERQMLNWLKYQKKRLAQGKLKPDRIDKLQYLFKIANIVLRKNQYAYTYHSVDGFCGDFFNGPTFRPSQKTAANKHKTTNA
ncbi:MAG: helicase associated domain-containing protein [Bacteroidaceae bacterium]|nr:helicase associated domain-containing protein [Bacteroidaceae bacterium]